MNDYHGDDATNDYHGNDENQFASSALQTFPNIAFPSFAIKQIKRFAVLCALFVGGGQP